MPPSNDNPSSERIALPSRPSALPPELCFLETRAPPSDRRRRPHEHRRFDLVAVATDQVRQWVPFLVLYIVACLLVVGMAGNAMYVVKITREGILGVLWPLKVVPPHHTAPYNPMQPSDRVSAATWAEESTSPWRWLK